MKPTPTLLAALSILPTALLLGGCHGGGEGASANAAPTPKPMTPESTAAAAKRYSQDVGPNAGP